MPDRYINVGNYPALETVTTRAAAELEMKFVDVNNLTYLDVAKAVISSLADQSVILIVEFTEAGATVVRPPYYPEEEVTTT